MLHLLQYVDLPKFIRLQSDLIHIYVYAAEIATFISSTSITSFDLLVLEDEWKLFQASCCATAFWSVIGSLPKSCHQICLSERGSYLPNNRVIPPYPTLQAPTNLSDQQFPTSRYVPCCTDQIEDLTLSLRIANAVGLATMRTFFLKQSQLTRLALDCSNQIDYLKVTSGLEFPVLESLYIYLDSAELPFPVDIGNSHLYSLRLTGSFPDTSSSFSSLPVILALPSVSHAALSSKFSTIIITNISKLRSLSLTAFITFPSPKSRGYCQVVESLTSALSECSQHSHLCDVVVEFVFPRRLLQHLSFCIENPVYCCSCLSASKSIKALRFVEVRCDVLSDQIVKYLCKWLMKFPALEKVTFSSDSSYIPTSLPSLPFFRKIHTHLKDLSYISFLERDLFTLGLLDRTLTLWSCNTNFHLMCPLLTSEGTITAASHIKAAPIDVPDFPNCFLPLFLPLTKVATMNSTAGSNSRNVRGKNKYMIENLTQQCYLLQRDLKTINLQYHHLFWAYYHQLITVKLLNLPLGNGSPPGPYPTITRPQGPPPFINVVMLPFALPVLPPPPSSLTVTTATNGAAFNASG
ncbi:hypothetical protein CPB83DRAFT_899985 [Crepidotus variabilis]|uniref:Uncharacterized protein n=1 Tax=Crepidotus variabilis TaxID=179855 RepID=A0A9P6JIF6_9AGAR|nr:hypothetical protein CPB83DRAFT_899985 [Crepidotus variabilis]